MSWFGVLGVVMMLQIEIGVPEGERPLSFHADVWNVDVQGAGTLEKWGWRVGIDRWFVGWNIGRLVGLDRPLYIEAGLQSYLDNISTWNSLGLIPFGVLVQLVPTVYLKALYRVGGRGTIGVYGSLGMDHGVVAGWRLRRRIWAWANVRYTLMESALGGIYMTAKSHIRIGLNNYPHPWLWVADAGVMIPFGRGAHTLWLVLRGAHGDLPEPSLELGTKPGEAATWMGLVTLLVGYRHRFRKRWRFDVYVKAGTVLWSKWEGDNPGEGHQIYPPLIPLVHLFSFDDPGLLPGMSFTYEW